jgi:hypothetical protein
MRFPETPVMKHTFDLFAYLGFKGNYTGNPSGKVLQRNERNSEGDVVIPYYMSTEADIQYFNGIRHKASDVEDSLLGPGKDAFGVGTGFGPDGKPTGPGTVPMEYIEKGPKYWMQGKTSYFKEALKTNFDQGWQLLKQYENYSTRQFLQTEHKELPLKPENTNRAYPIEVRFALCFFAIHCLSL